MALIKNKRVGSYCNFALILLSGFVAILLLLASCFIGIHLHTPVALEEPITVIITRGSSQKSIASQLHEAGVIRSPLIMHCAFGAASLLEEHNTIKSGEYLFEHQITPLEVLDRLIKGKIVLHKLTIPEGLMVQQIVDLLNGLSFLSGKVTTIPPEGSLLPNTYLISYNEDRNQVLLRMQIAMQKALKEITIPPDSWLKTKADVITLASIVEKETASAIEKPLVAAVFLNRLRTNQRLEADPTTAYGLTNGKMILNRRLTRKDTRQFSPYNTYVIYGLPPTPICNPGIDSIKAVLNPAKTDFLFFVAKLDGLHYFSKTLEEHNNYRHLLKEQRKQLKKQASPIAPPELKADNSADQSDTNERLN